MTKNIVLADRTLRMGLGMLLLASPLLELHTYPYNLLGLVLIATASVGFCPLYRLFSIGSRGQATGLEPRRARASARA